MLLFNCSLRTIKLSLSVILSIIIDMICVSIFIILKEPIPLIILLIIVLLLFNSLTISIVNY